MALNFIGYEQVFNSADSRPEFSRAALAEVLSLYCISEKYVKGISAMHKNNTAAVKVGNEVY